MKSISLHLIDDEKSFHMRFKIILNRIGIPIKNLKSFYTSDGLADNYKTSIPDVCLIDKILKGSKLNGLEVISELRNIGLTCKMGIISTSNKQEEIEECKKVGGDLWIVKTGSIFLFEKRMRKFKKLFIDEKCVEFNDCKKFVVIKDE